MGKQNHHRKRYALAFSLVSEKQGSTEEQRGVIERLLLESISLRGIYPRWIGSMRATSSLETMGHRL